MERGFEKRGRRCIDGAEEGGRMKKEGGECEEGGARGGGLGGMGCGKDG